MNVQDKIRTDPPINAADFGVPEEYLKRAEHYANWRVQQEREACAKLCEERVPYSMPISCPDGIPGCCVAHFAPGSRLKDGMECAASIRKSSYV